MNTIDQESWLHYWGDRGSWFICISETRDADPLEESNFRSIRKEFLGSEWEIDEVWAIEELGNPYCGWIKHLLINPNYPEAVKFGNSIQTALENYSVWDEDDYSALTLERRDHVTIDSNGYETDRKFSCINYDHIWEKITPTYISWDSTETQRVPWCDICEENPAEWEVGFSSDDCYTCLCSSCLTVENEPIIHESQLELLWRE